jgi:plasmid stability protein
MSTLTLDLPEPVFSRLREQARRANRTVEAELLDVLAAAVPAADGLPPELAAAVASLSLLDDAALWQTARNRLADDLSRRAEDLHHKRQRDGLTAAEAEEAANLVRQYERVLLLRAKAAEALHARGHDVSGLLVP